MIRRLKLVNFHGYGEKENEIIFSPGLNLILGDNASGKSTLIEALWLSIFQKSILASKIRDLITRHPEKKNEFQIELEFQGNDDITYTIITKQAKNRTIKILEKGVEIKDRERGGFDLTKEGDKGLPGFIASKLGLPLQIIGNVMIQRQEANWALWPVESTPAELGNRLAEIFQLQLFQKIYRNTNRARGRLGKKTSTLEGEVTGTRDRISIEKIESPEYLTSKVKDMEEEKSKLDQERERLDGLINVSLEDGKKIDTELNAINEKIGEFNKLKGSLAQIYNQMDRLEKEIGKPDRISVDKLKQRLEEKSNVIEKLDGKHHEATEQVGSVHSLIREFESRAKGIGSKVQATENEVTGKLKLLSKEFPDLVSSLELKSIEKTVRSFAQEMDIVTDRIARCTLTAQLIGKLGRDNKCPVCDSEISPSKRKTITEKLSILVKETKQLRALKEKLRVAKDDLEKLSRKIENLGEKLKDKNTFSKRAREKRKKLDKAKSIQKQLYAKLQDEKEQLELLRKTIDYLALVSYEKETKEKMSVPMYEGIEEARQGLLRKKEEMTGKIEELRRQQKPIIEKSNELGTNLGEVKKQLGTSLEVFQRLERLQKETSLTRDGFLDLNIAADAAKNLCYDTFLGNAGCISEELGRAWRALYVGEKATSLERIEDARLRVVPKLKEDEFQYEISIEVLGRDKKNYEDFRSFASSGQKVLGSIAFRLALLNSLKGKIFILDEPTIWVDKKRRDYMSKQLSQVVEAIEAELPIQQVIMVTHDEGLLQNLSQYSTVYRCEVDQEGYCAIRLEHT